MPKVDELRDGFAAPSPGARPMMRWWWFGPSVETKELDRELTALAEAGIGGVETAFVDPLGPVADGFGSAAFLANVRFAARRAYELGLRFDLTLGSGRPDGGGHIGPGHAAGLPTAWRETIQPDAAVTGEGVGVVHRRLEDEADIELPFETRIFCERPQPC